MFHSFQHLFKQKDERFCRSKNSKRRNGTGRKGTIHIFSHYGYKANFLEILPFLYQNLSSHRPTDLQHLDFQLFLLGQQANI